MSRNGLKTGYDTLATVTSREGRVSRNQIIFHSYFFCHVTSREGRVSRNSMMPDNQLIKLVTSREGRVSRNQAPHTGD